MSIFPLKSLSSSNVSFHESNVETNKIPVLWGTSVCVHHEKFTFWVSEIQIMRGSFEVRDPFDLNSFWVSEIQIMRGSFEVRDPFDLNSVHIGAGRLADMESRFISFDSAVLWIPMMIFHWQTNR